MLNRSIGYHLCLDFLVTTVSISSLRKSQQIRIIGGAWKSRVLRFANLPDLRPTPDAVREQLFNWLGHDLGGLSCLDLYAGSGALGFEAASRGASYVAMVECNKTAIRFLRSSRESLAAEQVIELFQNRAKDYLRTTSTGFDLAFIDPPFGKNLLGESCRILDSSGILNPGAKVYIETAVSKIPLPIPESWNIMRESRCGMVKSTLVQT